MTANEKAPAGATNTNRGTENLETGVSTIDPTPRPRVNPKNGKPKRRTWHIDAGRTADGRAKGLCGWESRPNPLASSGGSCPTDHIPVKCPDCVEILAMQDAAVRRRRRVEALAEFILDHLDKRGL